VQSGYIEQEFAITPGEFNRLSLWSLREDASGTRFAKGALATALSVSPRHFFPEVPTTCFGTPRVQSRLLSTHPRFLIEEYL
jgi:hypothetical protein